MKKVIVLLLIGVSLFGATRTSMKATFVSECYRAATQNGDNGNTDGISDYCKCVFDVATAKMSLNDLNTADSNGNSQQYKTLMNNLPKAIDGCMYNVRGE